jgi:WD40 repeat protein
MADTNLQELFARLNSQSSAGNQQPSTYQQPSVSSPIFSPSPSGPRPQHQSAVMSPNSSAANTPAPEQGGVPHQTPQQQSAHLLNLLRFNSQSGGTQSRRVSSQNTPFVENAPPPSGRAVSATDLVASFMGGKSTQAAPTSSTLPPAARPEPVTASTQNPQDLLMRLLNHPKPAQSDTHSPRASAAAFSPSVRSPMPGTAVEDVAQVLAEAKLDDNPSSSPMRVFGSDGTDRAHFELAARPSGPPKFTYVNPFEKLEAASPRNRTPVPESSKSPAPQIQILKNKHGLDASSFGTETGHQPKSRKLSPPESIHHYHPHETVAEAVSDLAEQVGKQVEEALDEVENRTEANAATEVHVEIEQAVTEAAVDIKKELTDDETLKTLEKATSKPFAAALKQVADEVAQGDNIADSWESAEDNPEKDDDQAVVVYRFPMRAFASITVNNVPFHRSVFPPELIMDVARLKKEFDQIDRSLVCASKSWIVYAIVKKGGFKVIRQADGNNHSIFDDQKERLFNVALCVAGEGSSESSVESVLGIGINGSVFWTSIETQREDRFNNDLDTKGLILPPSPSQDDNTSGGQLKTRAKPSSRHPEFFAVGRGKAIHIIWPRLAAEYLRPKTRIVQTEKFLKERSLKILTGKAGKDFTFSEDDTVVVSLDKAGRMRFWDIRPLTDPKVADLREPQQVEVSQTMLEYNTTSANAKSWPTSVFFFDKDKPYNKGLALRYVIVGMKQNHSFQLWDLGLGKAVQEINLPHEKESDAICSVTFHPKTGVMAVAHPTRNSIFFVHVSCPRYNLPVMNQAVYITRLASKHDKAHLPPVNATAIMTSMCEYSFASKGQIRSLHMLHEPAGPPDVDDQENNALFELYVMHSKGVCSVSIRRSDLGWKPKPEGEPINPREAEEEGVITISQMKPPQAIEESASNVGDAPKSVSDRSARESIKRENSSTLSQAAARANTLAKVESKQDAARAAIINGSEKSEKKKKKRSSETASQASTTRTLPPSYAQAAQATPRSKSPAQSEAPITESKSSIASQNESVGMDTAIEKKIEEIIQTKTPSVDPKMLGEIVQTEISKALSRELDGLHKRIDDDKRVMNASFQSKQDAILRLVSSTLTENVEGVIKKMVTENMRDVLLPQLLSQTNSTLEKNMGSSLKTALGPQLSKDIPDHISRAFKAPQMLQSLSDQVAKKVAGNLDQSIRTSMVCTITGNSLDSVTY